MCTLSCFGKRYSNTLHTLLTECYYDIFYHSNFLVRFIDTVLPIALSYVSLLHYMFELRTFYLVNMLVLFLLAAHILHLLLQNRGFGFE